MPEAGSTPKSSDALGLAETQAFGTPSSAEPPGAPSVGEEVVRDQLRSRLFGGPPPRIGRFRLLDRLGAGGMGTVFAAYDDKLDRKVAIKVLHHAGEHSSERLLAEARALARVVHPNVVAVHDVGEDGDRVYIAMEYLRGRSLRSWLEDERSWRETIAVLLEAGRGLAAAHLAQVLHRDFKPDNAILCEDGRVRVVDFGLARSIEGESHEDARDSRSVASSLTRTGAIVGTPAYMPLEQLRGEPLEQRADQFAFCATTYEALFGVRPFAGATVDELASALKRHELEEPATGRDVPAWLRDVVLRGLATKADDRWPSMNVLLETIERRLRRSGRAWILAAAGVVVAAASISTMATAPEPGCDKGEAVATALLDGDARSRAAQAFATAQPVYGADTWERVDRRLTTWSDDWRERYRYFCEATHVRKELSVERLDARMRCLERGWKRLETLVELFADADADLVQRAIAATESLEPPQQCDDAGLQLTLREVEVPPEVVEDEQRIRLRLEESAARESAGRFEESRAIAVEALAEAEKTDHLPLIADALGRLGLVLAALDEHEPAADHLRRAYLSAHESRRDEQAAFFADNLTFTTGDGLHDLSSALTWSDIAEASLRRLGDSVDSRDWAHLHRSRAAAWLGAGKADRALEEMHRAIELAGDEESLALAASLNNLGAILQHLGRSPEAVDPFLRAAELRERLQGPEHPMTLGTRNGLVTVLYDVGRVEEADARVGDLLAAMERVFGPEHLTVAKLLNNRGNAYTSLGRLEEALADHERALAIRRNAAPGSIDEGYSRINRAPVLRRLGRLEDARQDLEVAIAILSDKLSADHTLVARALINLGTVQQDLEAYDEAERVYRRAIEILARDEQSTNLARAHNNLANVLDHVGKAEDALDESTKALELLRSFETPDRGELGKVRSTLGSALSTLGRHDEAEVELSAALEDLEVAGEEPHHLAATCTNLARAAANRGAPAAEVKRWVERARRHWSEAPAGLDSGSKALEIWYRAHLDE